MESPGVCRPGFEIPIYGDGRLITFVPDRPGRDRRYAMDTSKAAAELGWKPQTPFAAGLRTTVD